MKKYEIRIYEGDTATYKFDFNEEMLSPELRRIILTKLREQMTKNQNDRNKRRKNK